MTSRFPWIGKAITLAIAAVGGAVAMGVESAGPHVPFVGRLVGFTLVLAVVFGAYEFLGQVIGRVVARVIPERFTSPSTTAGVPIGRRLSAGLAFAILGAYIAANLVFALVARVVVAFGRHPTLDPSNPPPAAWPAVAIPGGTLTGAAVMIWLTRGYASDLIRMPGPTGIGLAPVHRRLIAAAAMSGVAFGIFVLFVAPHLARLDSPIWGRWFSWQEQAAGPA